MRSHESTLQPVDIFLVELLPIWSDIRPASCSIRRGPGLANLGLGDQGSRRAACLSARSQWRVPGPPPHAAVPPDGGPFARPTPPPKAPGGRDVLFHTLPTHSVSVLPPPAHAKIAPPET